MSSGAASEESASNPDMKGSEVFSQMRRPAL